MSRRSFHQRVLDTLGRKIGTGIYAPGTAVPIESVLAAEFGVSRVVVREAIKVLTAKGMVAVRPRIGTRVLPRREWNLLDPDVIGWHDGARDGTFLRDLLELRRIVEPPAARLAAERATPDDVRVMRAALAAMGAALRDGSDYVTADLAFHGALLVASHNQFLQQLETAIAAILQTSFAISSRDPANAIATLPLHAAVLDGVERHDPEAAADAVERLIEIAGEQALAELLSKTG